VTADHDGQPAWMEGEPAFLLDEGTAYVRAWATAQHSVSALKNALAELGEADPCVLARRRQRLRRWDRGTRPRDTADSRADR